MHILNEFIAVATQLKVERPGKAAAFTSCDTVDGPIVKLKDGSVHFVNTEAQAKRLKPFVSEILYLGDVLINYGDFFDRAHPLVPAGYVQEEWIQEVEKAAVNIFGTLDTEKISELVDIDPDKVALLFRKPMTKISAEAAIHLSERLKVPLHPSHIFFWNSITPAGLRKLGEWLANGVLVKESGHESAVEGSEEEGGELRLHLKGDEAKRELELIGAEHSLFEEGVVLEEETATALLANLGVATIEELRNNMKVMESAVGDAETLTIVNRLSKLRIRDKCGTFIGARMGRPEKAKIRKLTSSPHSLFPVGSEGGKYRSIQSALQKGYINAQYTPYYCRNCRREGVFSVCEYCDKPAEKFYYCRIQDRLVKPDRSDCSACKSKVDQGDKPCEPQPYKQMKYNIKESFPKLLEKIGTTIYPDLIKGVKGTSNKEHVPEHLIKGILRAKHTLYVNKDGTIRYDCSEIPITHFKPKEIGTPISKLRELGYSEDIRGKPLENEDQVVEIKPQDVEIR